VRTSYAAGSYVSRQYTILNATGGVGGTFGTLATSNLPPSLKQSLSYDSTNVYLNTELPFAVPAGLNGKAAVGNAPTKFFNAKGEDQRSRSCQGSLARKMSGYRMAACGAKRPFICKQHPVTDQWESGSGRRRLTVPSGEPRHQCFGGICEHRGVRRSCFHPVRAERRRSVGDQMGRLSDPFAAASQNIALYRRLGRM
jgi:hypothetical protein